MPLRQTRFPQHGRSALHAFVSTLQTVAPHVPVASLQTFKQHSSSLEHATPSGTQISSAQRLFRQTFVQHSAPMEHAVPEVPQATPPHTSFSHVPAPGQQSSSLTQRDPLRVQHDLLPRLQSFSPWTKKQQSSRLAQSVKLHTGGVLRQRRADTHRSKQASSENFFSQNERSLYVANVRSKPTSLRHATGSSLKQRASMPQRMSTESS
jgi:hypothetical protein